MVSRMLSSIWRHLSDLLRGLLTGLLALLILFEEWGWEPLQQALAWFGRLPVLRQIERAIGRLPPRWALAVFLLPTLALLPVKLGALWLLARGHTLLGALLIVAAKVVGTGVVARLFALTRPALMTLPWFARSYARWVDWKSALLARVRASGVWRTARSVKQVLRARWARWRSEP